MEFTAFYGNRKMITCVRQTLPLFRTLSHVNLVHSLRPYRFKIRFNIILSSTFRASEWCLPLRFSNRNFIRVSNLPMSATYPSVQSRLIWTPAEPRMPSISTSLHSPVNHPNVQIFSSVPCSQTPSICVLSLMRKTKLHARTRQYGNLDYTFSLSFKNQVLKFKFFQERCH
jgi:hypothetical protein